MTSLISWISAFRLLMFLLYLSIALFVLSYSEIRIYFYAVTPYSLSERDLAVAWSFYLSWTRSYNYKVAFRRVLSRMSFSRFRSFLFSRSYLSWRVCLWHFSFSSWFILFVLSSWSLRLFSSASAETLWWCKVSYSFWSCAAYFLSLAQLADVLSYSILALEILAANSPVTFLSSMTLQ